MGSINDVIAKGALACTLACAGAFAQAADVPAAPKSPNAALAASADRAELVSKMALALYTRVPGKPLPADVDKTLASLSRQELHEVERANHDLSRKDLIEADKVIQSRRNGQSDHPLSGIINPQIRDIIGKVEIGTNSKPSDFDAGRRALTDATELSRQNETVVKGALRDMVAALRTSESEQRHANPSGRTP